MKPNRLALLICVAPLWACGSEATAPVEASRFQDYLEEGVAKLLVPGGVLAVETPDEGLWVGAAGMADRDREIPMSVDDRFGIGSITKTFTAAVILQLVEEGSVTLDQPLADFVPDFPRADIITLNHLLTHTSGIVDYAYEPEVVEGRSAAWRPEELIAVAAALPPLFGPGDDWDYSNTNYILIGLVIERITGNSWGREVRDRLIDPLALHNTFIATDEDVPGAARGYFGTLDWTLEISPSTGWAAGGIVSDAADLLRWYDALLYGDVLSEPSRTAMRTPVTLNSGDQRGYGIGLQLRSTPAHGRFSRVGHSGNAIIYLADFFHVAADGYKVLALVNGGSLSAGASTVSSLVWDDLYPPAN